MDVCDVIEFANKMKISVNVSIISGRKHISISCIVRCALLLYQVLGFAGMVGAEYRKARSMALQKISGRCLNILLRIKSG
jgi:hypothetical protein